MNAFHIKRRERNRANLRPGEFKCTGCKMVVFPEPDSVIERPSRSGALHLEGRCSECGAHVFQFASMKPDDCEDVPANPNASEHYAHEENTSAPAGIWNSRPKCPASNERLMYKWQKHAGKYSDKTIDRHLSSIRWMEEFVEFKASERLTVEDRYAIRNHL